MFSLRMFSVASVITDTSRSVLDIHIYTVEYCWYRIISLCAVLLINLQMDTYFVYGLGSIRLENTRARRSKMEVHVRYINILSIEMIVSLIRYSQLDTENTLPLIF